MTLQLLPEVGQWYRHRDKGLLFQVVACDTDSDCVELQDIDGDLDEVDFETWFAMPIEPSAEPEDPTGAGDHLELEDREYTLSADGAEPAGLHPLDTLLEGLDSNDLEEELPELGRLPDGDA
jgi:hypothetical protein